MRVTDSVRIQGSNRIDLAISTTAAQTAALIEGIYDIWSDVDCWIKVAPTASGVTVAAGANAGYKLMANNVVSFDLRHTGDNAKIGAVTSAGTGTLSVHRVG